MIWVLGTGQCGMHRYNNLLGGFIESTQELKELGVKRYHDPKTDVSVAYKVFKDRANKKAGCITDCGQFMFLDVICAVDKTAEFVWLIRKDKQKVVDLFMERVAEDKRIHPKGWDFAYKNKRKLLSWYYDEVNALIEKLLVGKKFKKVYTEDVK